VHATGSKAETVPHC